MERVFYLSDKLDRQGKGRVRTVWEPSGDMLDKMNFQTEQNELQTLMYIN